MLFRSLKESQKATSDALAAAEKDIRDILLVAGKGHETYQIVGDVKHHFDDREEVRKAFETLIN